MRTGTWTLARKLVADHKHRLLLLLRSYEVES